jgi:hypothetical protein
MTTFASTTAASTLASSVATQPKMEVLLAAQSLIEFKIDEHGGLLLKQSCWPNEDQTIYVNADYLDTFIDRLTDVCGVPSFPSRGSQ